MALRMDVLQWLTKASPEEAWQQLIDQVTAITSAPLSITQPIGEVTNRDRAIGEFDLFLSVAAFELWQTFGEVVERTSDRLMHWWDEPYNAKAVLILDGLSLRELPWLLQGIQERGYTLHQSTVTASELPGETNTFARALGFSSRSQLQNNGAGLAHRLPNARTESTDLPWGDCAEWVDGSPNWVFWHHWPDCKLHGATGAGQGLDTLTKDAAKQLSSDDFWHFVERLTKGRRLVITSDHGYAATGLFADATEEQGAFLKNTFKSGRSIPGTIDPGPFVPPLALQINSPHGAYLLSVGRWKWRSQGGYPTLAHGGLSLLEVLSPFIEISKPST